MYTITNLWSGRAGLGKKTWSRGVLLALGLGFAANLTAQTIDDPTATVKAMNSAQIDETMAAIAQQTTASAPIQSDATTTIVRAVYMKPVKTLVYVVQLSQPIPPEQAAKTVAGWLCKGKSVLALMERGVTYQYAVSTPTQAYNITFKRSDC